MQQNDSLTDGYPRPSACLPALALTSNRFPRTSFTSFTFVTSFTSFTFSHLVHLDGAISAVHHRHPNVGLKKVGCLFDVVSPFSTFQCVSFRCLFDVVSPSSTFQCVSFRCLFDVVSVRDGVAFRCRSLRCLPLPFIAFNTSAFQCVSFLCFSLRLSLNDRRECGCSSPTRLSIMTWHWRCLRR